MWQILTSLLRSRIHTNPKFLELRLCCCYCCSSSLASVWSKVECLKLLKLIISDLIIFINRIQDAQIFHFSHIHVSDMYHTGIVLDFSKIHTLSFFFSFLFLKRKYQYVQNTPLIQLEYRSNSTPDSERQPKLVKFSFILFTYQFQC